MLVAVVSDLYFAYGSNMSTARMCARVPEAEVVSSARLAGHRLVCDKQGVDGSGKANLRSDPEQVAWGVVYRLPGHAWEVLDRFEVAYARHYTQLTTPAGTPLTAQLYLAIAPSGEALRPFHWYRDHMLAGAREHALPATVIAEIESWSVIVDSREVTLAQT